MEVPLGARGHPRSSGPAGGPAREQASGQAFGPSLEPELGTWRALPSKPRGQTCQQPSGLGQGQERKLPASGGLEDNGNGGRGCDSGTAAGRFKDTAAQGALRLKKTSERKKKKEKKIEIK